MSQSKLRRQIAYQAARLMYDRQESEYYQAKIKAARTVCKERVKPKDLPSNAEIRNEVLLMAKMMEGSVERDRLRNMRVEAIRVMRILDRFKTYLIGSVLTGHIRTGSDIDIHVFADNIQQITSALDYHRLRYTTQQKRVVKNNERQLYRHIHIQDRFEIELTVYPLSKTSYNFKSSITGKAIKKASRQQLESLMKIEYPETDLEQTLQQAEEILDRFQVFEVLLLPLENVKQNPKWHPEGDALYHSLQVYDLACDQSPYDEEFLLAALLHDVGKAIDPHDHVGAGVQAVEEFVTERTLWLIKHHMLAHQLHDRTIGARARNRLMAHESYDDLVTLGECDRGGRKCGVEVTDVDEALEYIRAIDTMFG